MDGGQSRAPSGAQAPVKPPQGFSTAALDKRLGLRRRARDDAARSLPRHDADDLSEAERTVLEVVAAERARIDQARREAKAEIERRMRTLAPTPQDFQGPALDAHLALKQAAGRVAHDWGSAAARQAQARADLGAFKHANALRRAAVYPRPTLVQAALLFCAAAFAALISAALLAEGDGRGLLGGAITAIGLSGANVTLGYLAGFLGLRCLQHIRLPIKTMGLLAFAGLTALALMLNASTADRRAQQAGETGGFVDPGYDASIQFWSLLQLGSPQAIILLMLGAGVWAFAALKGYSGFDDPYPDYGKTDRAARAASDALSDLRAEARLELEAPINAARLALAARVEKMRAEFEAMIKAFDVASEKMKTLDAKACALDQAAADAVHLYRQENAALRATPAPAYFASAPPAAGPRLDALTAAAAMIDDARARVHQAQAQSAHAFEGLLVERDEAAARLNAGPAA